MTRQTALALAVIVALAVAGTLALAGGIAVVAADDDDTAPEDDDLDPELEVVYDEFRTDQSVVASVNDSGEAEVIKRNTRVTVTEDDAFVRLGIENPNSYAVAFEVELHELIVDPATLGTVRAVDNGDVTASWQASHDFENSETHTRVEVIVPADTEVLFAPSQLRIKSLSWTGDAEQSAETLRDRIASQFFDDDALAQRHYTVDGTEGEIVTIDLENPETGERVDDWHATYQLDGDALDRPLAEGSGDPVFYRVLEDEDGEPEAIQVTFNDPGEVTLTVEPTARERIGYDVSSYRASLADRLDIPFFGTIASDVDPGVMLASVTEGQHVW